MNFCAIVLASLLPVVPQPDEWIPANNAMKCDIEKAKVVTKKVHDKSLGEEGYRITIEPRKVTVEAAEKRGAIWAHQTIAQLKASGQPVECGMVLDKPKYRVRGCMMDVARMYHSLDFLYDMARTMSYYKMNVLHVHLNDNGIGGQWKDASGKVQWDTMPAAFRLECDTYPGLTAKDGHYTKKAFRQFIKDAEEMGVTVIPEIDVPAHSLAFTRLRPDFASTKYDTDHLDLDKMDEILPFLKKLLAEYMTGKDPVFAGKAKFFHIGTDEYDRRDGEKFRKFTDSMYAMVEEFGYNPCSWGSLRWAGGSTPVRAKKSYLIDIWSRDFYRPQEAIDAGYTIVATPDQPLYIVPKAGYYRDFLDAKFLYENWEPWKFWMQKDYFIDENHPQLAGGKFAVWNDKCGVNCTEDDTWARVFPAFQTLGQKLWSGVREDETWDQFKAISDKLGVPKKNKRQRP